MVGMSDLRSFISELESKGELIRIAEPVSSELEITEIADRVVKNAGPALLFENVVGKDFPVVIGLFGTRRRMAWSLGTNTLEDLTSRLKNLTDIKLGGGILGLASNLPKLREIMNLSPRRVQKAPVQEIVWRGEEIDLNKLPILKCWPQDGGPFITLPLVISKDPETNEINIGMYRMQVFGKNTTGMHWQRHKTGAKHLEKAKKLGKRLEVAVAIGGDPAMIYAATAPIPPVPGINEYSLCGYLRGKKVEVVRGITVNIDVPANAEFILEGYVDPNEELATEGPFGDHTGFYTLKDLYPTFHVTAVTMRQGAIYPATIVGRPPMEDQYMIEATERIFLVPAQLILPELKNYGLPACGIAHNLVNVQIEKTYPGQAYKVANGMLGLGQAMFSKVIVVIDQDIPPHNNLLFWQTALAHCLPGRDTVFTKGPIDVLDHSSRTFGFGSKLILDGTKKMPEETEGQTTSFEAAPARDKTEIQKLLATEIPDLQDQAQPGGGIWFVTTHKTQAKQGLELGKQLAHTAAANGIRLLAVVDDDTNPSDHNDVFWTLLNNIDPMRDSLVVEGPSGPVLVLDGTQKLASEGFKREWPEKITMSQDTKEQVTKKWSKFGITRT